MKPRLLIIGLLLSLTFFVQASTAFAEPRDGAACDLVAGSGKADGMLQGGKCVSREAFTSSSDPAPAKTPTTLPPNPDNSAAFSSVMMWIMSLFAWLVGVAAITLDNAVYYTVVTMGNYVSQLSAIGVTWRILRDIGNIALIFGFLAIGIATILNVNVYGYGKKMLPMLLVAAVFINFSLFISQAVIDVGNLFATQFYTQINGGKPAGVKDFDLVKEQKDGLSGKIMSQLGLQTLYNNGQANTAIFKATNSWVVGFMGIVIFLITAFVLFSLAFILIARFVMLIFLIILAPIGFAGLAIPKLSSTANKWWGALFEQTITAPVLLLLLYIALAVITDASFLTAFGKNPNWTGFVPDTVSGKTDLVGFASIFLSFLVAMGLLLAVVIVAKKMSAFGASHATGLAGKLSFGATAFGMRSTLGAGSRYLAQRVRTSKTLQGTKTGRLLSTTLDRGAKASFDVRGVTIGGGLKGGMGIDAGEAQKGGYQARREKAIKGHQEYIKSVNEAIDERGPTKAQQKAITDAENAKRKAEKDNDATKFIYEPAVAQLKSQVAQQRAEVDRLKTEQDTNIARGGVPDPETERKLDAARVELGKSETNLQSATNTLAAAAERLANAIAEEEKANKAPGKAAGEMKIAAATTYAGNIKGSLPGWVIYGPGGSVAARKIVKDAKKSPDQLLLDSLKKAIAAGEKKPEDEQKAKTEGASPAAPH